MTNATLIPPKHNPPSPRERMRGLAAGAILGVVIGSVAWWVFGELLWFSAIPICTVLGWGWPRSMNLRPRYFAAAQYFIVAGVLVATWYVLLSPIEHALGQLKFIFAPGYEKREFFVWLALSTLLTIAVAIAFWFKSAEAPPFAPLLVCLSVGLLGLAIWRFDATFILGYAVGCACAICTWLWPNTAVKRDAAKAPRPLP